MNKCDNSTGNTYQEKILTFYYLSLIYPLILNCNIPSTPQWSQQQLSILYGSPVTFTKRTYELAYHVNEAYNRGGSIDGTYVWTYVPSMVAVDGQISMNVAKLKFYL